MMAKPCEDSDLPLFATPPRFDGADYVPARDDARLTGQLRRIVDVMRDGRWRSLREIADRTGDPEASISAQLRHLRKPRFGAHTVERRREGATYQYRVELNSVAE
jgi:hypothetical protein